MLGHLFADIICSLKLATFLELHSEIGKLFASLQIVGTLRIHDGDGEDDA